ncbi:MAG: helix-turn-helix domain-containing protein [Verrucomicrobiales bacterium]|nr:helix-turn-helix domain-containing protein [Verrucomicrobiales bacterium]MDF1860515.1 helix-turn-helix domain-containing protein [Verrucomicrobiales bacterium]
MKTLLTKKKVAETLQVSTRTVCRYMNQGWLKPIRLSDQTLRFDPDDLQRFIEDGGGGVTAKNNREKE